MKTASRIIAEICSRFSVTPAQLECQSRAWKFVYPRWLAISLIRSKTQFTLNAVGALFNRKHMHVLYAIHGLHDEMLTNTNAKHDWESLCAIFQ